MDERNYITRAVEEAYYELELMGAREKLLFVLSIAQKTPPSYVEPIKRDEHWDKTLAILGEASRQILRDRLPMGKLKGFLQDPDDRIGTLLLIGIKSRLKFDNLSPAAADEVISVIKFHPSRQLREAGMVLLDASGYIKPTPIILRYREGKARRDFSFLGIDGKDALDRWMTIRPLRWTTIDEAESSRRSPLFDGRTWIWQWQNAFPIMALLWYGGPAEISDLNLIDPNLLELKKDLNSLMELKEVETFNYQHKTFYRLARPDYWAGPPW